MCSRQKTRTVLLMEMIDNRYYILRKGPNTPMYSERFHTYGNNKVSHMNNLIVNGEMKMIELKNRISILYDDSHIPC